VGLRVTDNDGLSSEATATTVASVDGDTIPSGEDNCPLVANQGQEDSDGDHIGDACDDDPFSSPPTAAFFATPQSGVAPLAVQFDASASTAATGGVIAFGWDFGDGGDGTGVNPTHTYASPGLFNVVLTAIDSSGGTASVTQGVTVSGSDQNVYFALGDSWSSGEALPPFSPGGEQCRRSPEAFPNLVAQGREVPNLAFLACSGATIDNVVRTERFPGDTPGGQTAPLRAGNPGLVTVTIGRRDANFGDIFRACRTQTRCDQRFPGESGRIDSLYQPLRTAFGEIKQAAAFVPVYVLTYAQTLAPGQACQAISGLEPQEIAWLRGNTSHLNAVITRAAEDADATTGTNLDAFIVVLDGEHLFDGHESCASQPWVVEGEHPNALGQAALARRILQ
jgi:PKD repeat protein